MANRIAQALESVLDRAFAEADSDDDGEATWEEMLANPKFAYGQFGNLVPEDEGERARLIQMYDNNRNALVERDELPRFLTRKRGRFASLLTAKLERVSWREPLSITYPPTAGPGSGWSDHRH